MPNPAPAPAGYTLVEHFGGVGSQPAAAVLNNPACTAAGGGFNDCYAADFATGLDICNSNPACSGFFQAYPQNGGDDIHSFVNVGHITGLSRQGDSCFVYVGGLCDDLYMYIKDGEAVCSRSCGANANGQYQYTDTRTGTVFTPVPLVSSKTTTAPSTTTTTVSSSSPSISDPTVITATFSTKGTTATTFNGSITSTSQPATLSNPPTANSGPGTGPSGAVIGGAIGGAAACLLVAIGIFVYARRRTTRGDEQKMILTLEAPRSRTPEPSPADPSAWDADRVSKWARDAGFSPEIVHILARARVDGPRLVRLTDDGLVGLGVASAAARANIIASVRATTESGVGVARREMQARGGEDVLPPSYTDAMGGVSEVHVVGVGSALGHDADPEHLSLHPEERAQDLKGHDPDRKQKQ